MRIGWDEAKNQWLITERYVCFEDAAFCILNNQVLDVLKNPSRPGQFYFIMTLNDYTHVVPFVIRQNEDIFLKTIFPSRKFHKKYGGKK